MVQQALGQRARIVRVFTRPFKTELKLQAPELQHLTMILAVRVSTLSYPAQLLVYKDLLCRLYVQEHMFAFKVLALCWLQMLSASVHSAQE